MKVNRINVEISTLANKHYYLREQMYSLTREHNCFYGSEFGKDYISINNAPEGLLKVLEGLKIKFKNFT